MSDNGHWLHESPIRDLTEGTAFDRDFVCGFSIVDARNLATLNVSLNSNPTMPPVFVSVLDLATPEELRMHSAAIALTAHDLDHIADWIIHIHDAHAEHLQR